MHLVSMFDAAKAPHLLGFKFQCYQSRGAEDAPCGSAPTPLGLYKLAAVLVRAGVLSVDALYGHLAPEDAPAAAAHKAARSAAMEAVKRIGVVNLAATAKDEAPPLRDRDRDARPLLGGRDAPRDSRAPLGRDADPRDARRDSRGDARGDVKSETKADAKDKPAAAPAAPAPPREPSLLPEDNQKYGLVQGFLEIGEWERARELMLRLQRAGLDALSHPPVAAALRRLLAARTAPLAKELLPPAATRPVDASASKGSAKAKPAPPAVPSVTASAELFEILGFLGHHLAGDARLFCRMARLLRAHVLASAGAEAVAAAAAAAAAAGEPDGAPGAVAEAVPAAVRDAVDTALRNTLLPALSLVLNSPAAASEVWSVLALFPYTTRFRLYADWRAASAGDAAPPALAAAAAEATQETKKVLRRLSKDNVKDFGRRLGKAAHAAPLPVCATLLAQIEAYSSMIAPVVDALKYLTPLGYDVVTFVLLDMLSSGREKLKSDGQNVSLWLSSLANLAGQLAKRYPGVGLTPLLRYVAVQLADDATLDLLVLKEVVARMSGVESLTDLSDAQLEAAAGSETLRAEAASFAQPLLPKARAKGVARLRAALNAGADPLTLPLLLLMAQARNHILFQMETNQLKLIGMLYDQCNEVLRQYAEFVALAHAPVASYATLLPPLPELVTAYSMPPEVAFHLYRPVLRLLQPRPAGADAATARALDVGPCKYSWAELTGAVSGMLPAATWTAISPELYITFWSLSLQDLSVPKASYDERCERARAAIALLEASRDNTPGEPAKRKREVERLRALCDKLASERDAQATHVAAVDARLAAEKDSWLSGVASHAGSVSAFLQACVLPRAAASLPDAVFCARFVARMHSLGTPFFSTLQYYDRVLKDLRQLVFAATEHEAAHLGRFLYETLAQLAAWRRDESAYARECASQPGFGSNFLDRDSRRATYADFVAVSLKWHQKVVRSLVACLESKEYMEIRNALLVLTRVSRAFPATRKHGAYLEKRVAKIKAEDPREDLKTLAGRYWAVLQKERPSWVSDEEFSWAGPGPYVPPKPPPPPPKPKVEALPPKAASEAKSDAKPRDDKAGKSDDKSAKPSVKEEKPPLAEAARRAAEAARRPLAGGAAIGSSERDRERDRERERDRGRDAPQERRREAEPSDRDRDRRDTPRDAPRESPRDTPRDAPRDAPRGDSSRRREEEESGRSGRGAAPDDQSAKRRRTDEAAAAPGSREERRSDKEREPREPRERERGDEKKESKEKGKEKDREEKKSSEKETKEKERKASKESKEKEREKDSKEKERKASVKEEKRSDKGDKGDKAANEGRERSRERAPEPRRREDDKAAPPVSGGKERDGGDRGKERERPREREAEKPRERDRGGDKAPPPPPPPPARSSKEGERERGRGEERGRGDERARGEERGAREASPPRRRDDGGGRAPPPPPLQPPPPPMAQGRERGPPPPPPRTLSGSRPPEPAPPAKRPRDEPPPVEDAKRHRPDAPQPPQARRFPPAREPPPPPPRDAPRGGDARDLLQRPRR